MLCASACLKSVLIQPGPQSLCSSQPTKTYCQTTCSYAPCPCTSFATSYHMQHLIAQPCIPMTCTALDSPFCAMQYSSAQPVSIHVSNLSVMCSHASTARAAAEAGQPKSSAGHEDSATQSHTQVDMRMKRAVSRCQRLVSTFAPGMPWSNVHSSRCAQPKHATASMEPTRNGRCSGFHIALLS